MAAFSWATDDADMRARANTPDPEATNLRMSLSLFAASGGPSVHAITGPDAVSRACRVDSPLYYGVRTASGDHGEAIENARRPALRSRRDAVRGTRLSDRCAHRASRFTTAGGSSAPARSPRCWRSAAPATRPAFSCSPSSESSVFREPRPAARFRSSSAAESLSRARGVSARSRPRSTGHRNRRIASGRWVHPDLDDLLARH